MTNLTTRVITAVVAIPAVVFVILQGGWWFTGFVMLISGLGLWEYYKLCEARGAHPQKSAGIIAGLLLQLLLYHFIAGSDDLFQSSAAGGALRAFLVLMAFFSFFVLVVHAAELWRNREFPLFNTATTIGGVAYLSFFFACLIALRQFYILDNYTGASSVFSGSGGGADWGGAFILIVFVSIWICDSVAYFVGRALGRHKLFLRVSPGKSWEGAIAGFVSSVIAFPLLLNYFLPGFPLHHALILGGLIGSISQVGDLAESLLKRDAGVKDSSQIIPGHGGVLDRFDSILFVAPTVFVYLLCMALW